MSKSEDHQYIDTKELWTDSRHWLPWESSIVRICLGLIFTWDLGQRKSPQHGETTLFLFSFPENNHPYSAQQNHGHFACIFYQYHFTFLPACLCSSVDPTFFFTTLILFIAKLNANRVSISQWAKLYYKA